MRCGGDHRVVPIRARGGLRKPKFAQKRKPAAGLIEKRLHFEGDHLLWGWEGG
jgi:hypothetical protein